MGPDAVWQLSMALSKSLQVVIQVLMKQAGEDTAATAEAATEHQSSKPKRRVAPLQQAYYSIWHVLFSLRSIKHMDMAQVDEEAMLSVIPRASQSMDSQPSGEGLAVAELSLSPGSELAAGKTAVNKHTDQEYESLEAQLSATRAALANNEEEVLRQQQVIHNLMAELNLIKSSMLAARSTPASKVTHTYINNNPVFDAPEDDDHVAGDGGGEVHASHSPPPQLNAPERGNMMRS